MTDITGRTENSRYAIAGHRRRKRLNFCYGKASNCSGNSIPAFLNYQRPGMHELIKKSATEIVELLKRKEVSPQELIVASEQRIKDVDPHINAMPTLCIDIAMKKAKQLVLPSCEDQRGYLWGLPISVKDLQETAGVRTTFGSPIYKDYVPTQNELSVGLLERNGAIVVGKSNTPEFGAGASTFNEVFGITRNPWNTSKSVAGSSGGACASVASGEVWLATGSDLGGSLRTPASFNSVVGLRPSPGRVPRSEKFQPFNTLFVNGPIGRNCEDVALFLDAMSGLHPSDPLTYPVPEKPYVDSIQNPVTPMRIGYSSDLGITFVDPEVDQICRNAIQKFKDLGTDIEEASPDFSGAIESFGVLRALSFANNMASDFTRNRALLKPEIVWNIEQGLHLTAADIGRAEATQAKIFHSVAKFFEKYDLLACPCAIVPPYDAELRYVESVGDVRFETYYEWIAITFSITLTACPVLAIPAGFTKDGLPVGLQLVASPRREDALLSAGHLLEQLTGIPKLLPIDPLPP